MTISIPSSQSAAVIDSPGPDAKVRIDTKAPVERPSTNQVLVKLAYSGLCKSEIRAYLGWGKYQPIVGHEGVGTVVQVGEGVSDSLLGQRVGVKWLFSACGDCHACSKGAQNNCANQLNTGLHVRGTLQQYALADARYLTRIPEPLKSEVVCPLLCAGMTMAGALGKLDGHLTKGDWVVISGSGGGLGHLGVQIASRLKEYRVIAIDSGLEKRVLSLECGAQEFIDFATENVEERIKAITGEGAHACLVVSGSEEAFRAAPKLVRNMGYILLIGLPPATFDIPIPVSVCAARGLTLIGVITGTEQQMEELLRQAADRVIAPKIEVKDFDELPELFEKLKRDEVVGRIVVQIPE